MSVRHQKQFPPSIRRTSQNDTHNQDDTDLQQQKQQQQHKADPDRCNNLLLWISHADRQTVVSKRSLYNSQDASKKEKGRCQW